ncbi:MAG: NAD(P)-binding domain-containing protein, partial [Pseudomonadota bacterium]
MSTTPLSSTITVLGAGSWGTALALALARNGQSVRLWGHDIKHLACIAQERRNARYLPDAPLFPDNLTVHADLAEALTNSNDVLIVVPSDAFRDTLVRINPYLTSESRLAWGTKGLDPQSDQLLHDVVVELRGKQQATAMLSGPTFAREVALGMPTAITVASQTSSFARDLTTRLHQPNFRV